MSTLTRSVWVITGMKLVFHLGSSAQGYGFFGDELYYLACADHLDFGYVDHPPLSIGLLALWRVLFGDSLLALRSLAALFGAAAVVCGGLLARQLGGGRHAQTLTALALAFAPVNLVVHGYYSMNGVDILVWLVAFLLIARILRDPTPRRWLGLGVWLGLGLLDKLSVGWLGLGLLAGLVATPHRALLRSPWPWVAGAISALFFLPHVLWQVAHGWPTLEFVRVATREKMLPVGPIELLAQQILALHPLLFPVWVAGLVELLRRRTAGRGPEALYAAVFLTTATILIANGTSRPNYLALAQPPLIAAGAIALERLSRQPRLAWALATFNAVFAAAALALAPLTVPLLPVPGVIALQARLGLEAPRMEASHATALPHHFAFMLGWPEIVASTARVWNSLAEEERERAAIYSGNYAVAGAIDRFGRDFGLPRAISSHNSYWLWGPRDTDGQLVLLLGGNREDYTPYWQTVEPAATWDCGACSDARNHQTIWIARGAKLSIQDLWARARSYR